MSRVLDQDGRHRDFPFPRMDSPRTPSSGSSLQARSESSQSKSLCSSSSSSSHHHHHRHHHSPPPRIRGGDRGSGESSLPDVQQKLLAHLMPRDAQASGSRSLRTALAITTERLEGETRRADDAERRVLEVLRKLRAQHEATMLAQAEASRAKEELTLYKFRLEEAQREILRANEAIADLEEQKNMAEAEAARARSTARKFREQQLIARAREEGRQEGFQEGYSRGNRLGYEEATFAEVPRERRYGGPRVEEVPEEDEETRPRYRAGTPGPTEMRILAPAPEYRSQSLGPPIVPSGRLTPSVPPQPRRSPSRLSTSRASQRPHVPDTAHHAPTLPVPTVVTPLNVPSPSHSRANTPTGMPIAHPAPHSLDDGEAPPPPLPVHDLASSLVHPPVDIPPDGWIPYAAGPNAEISLPPPHELSRPVSPVSSVAVSPTPPPPPILQPLEPAQPVASSSAIPPPPQLVSRGYPEIPPEGIAVTRSNASRPMSPQSKASTTISQFDIIRAPPGGKLRISTGGRAPREDRQVSSPRGPRPREDFPLHVGPPAQQEKREPERLQRPERERTRTNSNPLEKLFKKRYKTFKDSPPVQPPVIPDIIVESPSTPSTHRYSLKTTGTHPSAFLSPELATQPLASSAPQDNIIVMRTEIPGYNPNPQIQIPFDDDDPFIPPRPETIPAEAAMPAPAGDQFPAGFVPLAPTRPSSALGPTPIPVPSNTPVPIPPPSNPIPVPSNTPVPIPPPSNPLPVPYNEAVPIPSPSPAPLPIPQNEEVLPVPQRGPGTGSPRQARYDEAPIPAGVVYPERATPRLPGAVTGAQTGTGTGTRTGTPTSSLSPKSRRGRLDMRSPGANLSPLPIQFQFFAPLRSDTTSESIRL